MSDEDLKSYIKSYYLYRKRTYTKLDKHDRAIGVLLEENKKLTKMLYRYRNNINQLYSYLYDKDGIAIICDIKKLFEILGDKENE